MKNKKWIRKQNNIDRHGQVWIWKSLVYCVFLFGVTVCTAQRDYSFSQVDLPHNYYYKELYIPQLTSGPSSLCWSPDGRSLAYSMAGTLWLQEINSLITRQITDGDGYDYQADWSPDGNKLVFTRYDGKAMNLMLLDLTTGELSELSTGDDLYLEPRWSPDGSHIAYVSTAGTGHFLLYVAELSEKSLKNIRCLSPDRKSEVARYYYSAFDHAINPSWSNDGKRILCVSNREIAHGTGNIVSISLDNPNDTKLIQKEETSWRARPEYSPDGSRILYSSYLGQNWHQLWIVPSEGGYALPLTYGEYDHTNARWSPDGGQIAYISNESGNTSIVLLDAFSGKKKAVTATQRAYRRPARIVRLTVLNEHGDTMPSRISITDSRQKFYGPPNALWHADDSRHPNSEKFEYRYFHCQGNCEIAVPDDSLDLRISHGFNYPIMKHRIKAQTDRSMDITIRFNPNRLPEEFGEFWSGDLHVHMNYAGHYRNTPRILRRQAEAEDLNFLYNLIVNKEQRIPDIRYFSPDPDAVSDDKLLIMHGQEFHTSFWGHLGLLNLNEHLIIPDYVGYPYTGVASLFPHNGYVADRVHEQNGLVGYVHPFLSSEIFPQQSEGLHNALPVDAALGKADYYEIPSFADHLPTEHVWHQLLNSGIRIPAGGGTDAMANYASLRGPVGVNRSFLPAEGELSPENVARGIKQGRGFVSNAPLLGFQLGNARPGDEIRLDTNAVFSIPFKAAMRSSVPVENVEIVFNGRVVGRAPIKEGGLESDYSGNLRVNGSGWLTLRAWSANAHPDLQDFHVYASTNPIYITGPEGPYRSRSSCAYFLPWIERIEKEVLAFDKFRTEAERESILADVRKAREYYQNCSEQGNNQ